MNYGNIKTNDISNGRGVRTSLFVSGCTRCCKGCFNPETWDFNYGKPFTKETEDMIINSLKPFYVEGLTVLGGEPFEKQNQLALLPFIKRVKNELPQKTIWFYTGCTYEELLSSEKYHTQATDELLALTDVLVDGEFLLDKKNISLNFKGSENQRIIDIKATQKNNKITEYKLN